MIFLIGTLLAVGLSLQRKRFRNIPDAVFKFSGKFKGKVWYTYLRDQANLYGFPINVIEAQVKVESDGDPDAKSRAGAIGLFQIKPIVLKEYNQVTNKNVPVEDLTNPHQNITIGLWYLNRLMNHYQFGNLRDSLMAYANGLGNVKKIPPKLPHPDYADKIFDLAGIS